MSTAPKEVPELVQKFERNIESYRSLAYNETQARREFIDPLFEILGWDIANRQGFAEAYKEVIHEAMVKVGVATKAPDYAFRIGGTKKFFLEAKKPGVDIKNNPEPAYQLRRYAWSAGLPLSILTDFEEFAVYDCRIRPQKSDKPSVARIKYLTYQEYESRWDEIAEVFSKQAIQQGSFDRFAASAKGKRGTSPVDDAFLKEIEEWRSDLARNLARKNRRLKVRDLNFAVQRIIDRIIFLRMCEDRGIEKYEQLRALLNGENVYARLKQLFYAADDKYNSGLFHFKPEPGRAEKPDELTDTLKIDNEVLKHIIGRLYYPESPYEFSVLSGDILGNVYEQFLGKVIHLTKTHQARIEEKPEVKKAGGVYYTPKYIVDYIVKNTVGKLCEGKTPKQIEKLKILDPACGSGSFLIGAYSYLLDYHRNWYEQNAPAKFSKEIFQGSGGQWYLTTQKKKEILLNNIFGVDIDSQAVEVTKLNLLLKVLEGETKDTLESQMRLWHLRALPDLGNNIKCGNSLIGPDYYHGKQQSLFDEEEQIKVNAFDWKSEFPEIMKQGGFDAVIGNPPYIQLSMEEYFNEDVSSYLSQYYSSSMGRLNTFGLFIERSLKILLTNDGLLSFIVPNTILTQEYYQLLRQLMLKNRIVNLTNFLFPVFRKAVVETVIFVVQKTSPNQNSVEVVDFDNRKMSVETSRISQTAYQSTHKNAFLVKLDEKTDSLKTKLNQAGQPLNTIANINQAIALKHDRSKSLFNQKRAQNYRPVLDGRNIQRFSLNWDGYYLAYDVRKIHSCKRTDIFEAKEKIFFRRVGERLTATYDNKQFYALNTLVVITPKPQAKVSLKYILGLLNSKLLNFYYVTYLKSTKKIFSEIQARQISQLPLLIPNPVDSKSQNSHSKIALLVEQILELHKQLHKVKMPDDKTRIERQIEATDRQIDQLVYELYGLTEEEIAVVEGQK